MRLIFVHGWGFNAQSWRVLIDALPAYDVQCAEFGFLGDDVALPDERAVYITHSLGTMWALKERAPSMTALISINGFSCFSDLVDARVLGAMQKRLSRGAQKQMQDFWGMCGAAPDYEALNQDKLAEGLSWLAAYDARDALANIDVPVLSLLGAQDKIAPLEGARKQWSGCGVRVCDDGGHMLPATHAEWCAAQIAEFLDGL